MDAAYANVIVGLYYIAVIVLVEKLGLLRCNGSKWLAISTFLLAPAIIFVSATALILYFQSIGADYFARVMTNTIMIAGPLATLYWARLAYHYRVALAEARASAQKESL
ncbi:hypothetical protein VIBNISOn1_1540045 [Vibrio nigripulchritudo SOn1]|uniref:Uncharacterized protein n=1 Tax=Vibrio nigripulchritudo SOn1 TaxID=1238450 RepID=A0AAV2VMB5_9VIBR|nr:hypothetical protein [Vibrio nigripulchritudo]CCO45678.1 hypothetical protein VIBNISOn1_1540045 [Vibrio nigripulchritudo SOn1]